MSSTDEPYVDPLTSRLPSPSTESVKADTQPPRASVEPVRLSEDPQPTQPQPSIDYERKNFNPDERQHG